MVDDSIIPCTKYLNVTNKIMMIEIIYNVIQLFTIRTHQQIRHASVLTNNQIKEIFSILNAIKTLKNIINIKLMI